jgi:hypothetical protein
MTATNDLNRLQKQVARNPRARAAFISMMDAADAAESHGWVFRKGGHNRSASNGETYVYAAKDGDESLIWSGVTLSAGYQKPLTSVQLADIESAIKALA